MSGFYFGCDSSTGDNPCGMDFYIGKLGESDFETTSHFSTSAANEAGKSYTYGYWFLHGPNDSSAEGYSPYQWGKLQGNKAVDAWANGPYSNYIYGLTIFGDVEVPGSYGWSSNQRDNQNVVKGFCDAVNASAQAGIYSGYSAWNGICGSSFNPKMDAGAKVIWEVNDYHDYSDSCPNSMQYHGFGGAYPSIVQYQIHAPNGSSRDYDIGDSLPT